MTGKPEVGQGAVFVAFAGKLFVWPLATADPAVMSHPDSFQRLSSKMINRKWWNEGHGRE
jgi:hypothetical protein